MEGWCNFWDGTDVDFELSFETLKPEEIIKQNDMKYFHVVNFIYKVGKKSVPTRATCRAPRIRYNIIAKDAQEVVRQTRDLYSRFRFLIITSNRNEAKNSKSLTKLGQTRILPKNMLIEAFVTAAQDQK